MEDRYALEAVGLRRFSELRHEAVEHVLQRFYTEYAAEYARFGEQGRIRTREDLAYQLDFVRPVLEFGLLEPYVEFQRWLVEVLGSRRVPTAHVGLSLEWLGEFFAAHMPEQGGARIAEVMREAWRQAQLPASETPRPEAPAEQDVFTKALLEGNRRLAESIVEYQREAGRPLPEIQVALIQGSLYDIGERWRSNLVSVAQEHLATATARTVMADSFATAEVAPPNGRRALFACVEGNEHAVGLQMVADAHELDGWEVQCLGASVPTRALVEQVEAWKPELVGLSIAFPHQLAAGRDAIRQLRERLGARCPRIMVGGQALNRFKPLAAHLGADLHAEDALAALRHSREALAS